MTAMHNFAACLEPGRLEYLSLFCGFMHDSKEFRVSPRFFGWVAQLSPEAQALRLVVTAGQISSDLNTETQEPLGGRGVVVPVKLIKCPSADQVCMHSAG